MCVFVGVCVCVIVCVGVIVCVYVCVCVCVGVYVCLSDITERFNRHTNVGYNPRGYPSGYWHTITVNRLVRWG